jgi:hypothetical protein
MVRLAHKVNNLGLLYNNLVRRLLLLARRIVTHIRDTAAYLHEVKFCLVLRINIRLPCCLDSSWLLKLYVVGFYR